MKAVTQVFKGSALLDSHYGKIFVLEGWHGKHQTGIDLPVNPSLSFKVQWTRLPCDLRLSKERFIFGQSWVCLILHVVYLMLLKVLDFLAEVGTKASLPFRLLKRDLNWQSAWCRLTARFSAWRIAAWSASCSKKKKKGQGRILL